MILPEFCCFSVPWSRVALKILGRSRFCRAGQNFGHLGSVLLVTLCLSACTSETTGFETAGSGGEARKIVQDSQRDQELRENMQRVQMAAEHYASNHGSDHYPTVLDDEFKSYFPGGVEGKRPAPVGPVNVYTGVNEFPTFVSVPSVSAIRMGGRFPIAAGKINYAPLDNGSGYAIMGGAGDGQSLMDDKRPEQVLVLSNIE